jgi:phage tail sheath protein FI
MQAAVAGNDDLRDPSRNFTLLCAPNFPELTDELVTLNSDRGETGFIIIDVPMRKTPTQATSWMLGVGATENGDEGLVTKNTYSAVYYPSGRSTTPAGNTVTVPASHMVLYTYAYNDNISYPWFAPAGLTRGVVQNGSAVGYITSEEEFKAVSLSQGQRDAAYLNKLNPIANFPLEGVVVFGQKTLHPTSTALDRVNVARLVAYLRERFDIIARPLLFDQNDKLTRDRAVQLFESFLSDLLTKRALTDFAVVCDESNNTPIRIDRNELYIDIAIAPTKAVEFIYIPIRIVNTGAL